MAVFPHRFKRRGLRRRVVRSGRAPRFGTTNNPGFYSPGVGGRVALPARYTRPT